MKKIGNGVRLFLLWGRRWLATSKPTEWLTAIATSLGVAGAFVTGLIVYNSGLFEIKRSELNIHEKELIAKENAQNIRVAELAQQLRESQAAVTERDKAIVRQLREHQAIVAQRDQAISTIGQIFGDAIRMQRTFVFRDPMEIAVGKFGNTPVQIEFLRDITPDDLDKGATIQAKITRPEPNAPAHVPLVLHHLRGSSLNISMDRQLTAEDLEKGVTIPVKIARMDRK